MRRQRKGEEVKKLVTIIIEEEEFEDSREYSEEDTYEEKDIEIGDDDSDGSIKDD